MRDQSQVRGPEAVIAVRQRRRVGATLLLPSREQTRCYGFRSATRRAAGDNRGVRCPVQIWAEPRPARRREPAMSAKPPASQRRSVRAANRPLLRLHILQRTVSGSRCRRSRADHSFMCISGQARDLHRCEICHHGGSTGQPERRTRTTARQFRVAAPLGPSSPKSFLFRPGIGPHSITLHP